MHTGTHPGLAAVAVPPAHHGPRQDDGGGPDAGADVRPGGPPHAAGGAPRPAPARTPPVGFPTSRGAGPRLPRPAVRTGPGRALVEFSRNVMRERFSAFIHKPAGAALVPTPPTPSVG